MYYRALGAVRDCDAQGNMIEPISFDDWKRKNGFGTPPIVTADYINQRDLNLVRRMVATRSASAAASPSTSATPPAPTARARTRSTTCIETGLNGERQGRLRGDGVHAGDRGERRPAVHQVLHLRPRRRAAGSRSTSTAAARSSCPAPASPATAAPPTTAASPRGGPSPYPRRALPAVRHRQLPVLVAVRRWPRRRRARRFFQLNQLVARNRARSPNTPTSRLINGWYANGHAIDKSYVPAALAGWPTREPATRRRGPVLPRSGRHLLPHLPRRARPAVSTGTTIVLSPARAKTQFCGGTPDIAINAQHAERADLARPPARARRERRRARGADGRSSSAAPRRRPTRSMPSADRRRFEGPRSSTDRLPTPRLCRQAPALNPASRSPAPSPPALPSAPARRLPDVRWRRPRRPRRRPRATRRHRRDHDAASPALRPRRAGRRRPRRRAPAAPRRPSSSRPAPIKFEDSVSRAGRAALSRDAQATLGPEPRLIVDRPAHRRQHRRPDGQHGEDGRRSSSRVAKKDFRTWAVTPLTRNTLATKPLLLIGTLTPVNIERSIDKHARRVPRLADADRPAHRQGRRQGARPRDGRLGESPSRCRFYRDSPTWHKDNTILAYINSCQVNTKIGDPADPEYLARLPAAAVINEAILAYDEGKHPGRATGSTRKREPIADPGDLRVLNGLYLTSWQLGQRDAGARRVRQAGHLRPRAEAPAGEAAVPARPHHLHHQSATCRSSTRSGSRRWPQQAGKAEPACASSATRAAPAAPRANETLSRQRAEAVQRMLEREQPGPRRAAERGRGGLEGGAGRTGHRRHARCARPAGGVPGRRLRVVGTCRAKRMHGGNKANGGMP